MQMQEIESKKEKEQSSSAYRICVYGIVQGVGFRPFVNRIADSVGIRGSVANRGSYVEIFACGTQNQIRQFRKLLESDAPERSAILKISMQEIDREDKRIPRESGFSIIESEHERGSIFVSPDIATCPKCRQELYDPKNRRYLHPFINCTACGPRLTILDSMPYDRIRTSMGEFPMCPQCAYEYTHAESRRYDAQPVCCNDCGPQVYLIDLSENKTELASGIGEIPVKTAGARAAITGARQAILDGKIIAIKGIGGFHLCCNAKNEAAVRRLRELKKRPAKPFAVMMKDLDTVRRECQIPDPSIEKLLDGHQKPIILLEKQKEERKRNLSEGQKFAEETYSSRGYSLAPSVAPDNPKVGVMLPYAPVQMLLFEYDDDLDGTTDCLVMTSGNVSGAPICRTDEDAIRELGGFCDLLLSHDRKIRLRADDTVVSLYEKEPYMIRRSRGYAPLPVMMSDDLRGSVLGIGGELKNTFCLGRDQLLYESPYVGDMADIRTVQALEESILRMEELLETSPELVICDLHPRYNTTLIAQKQGIPVISIQHHYAHVLSCMAENDFLLKKNEKGQNQRVLGLSLDGTGYGTDGTIWGGECLLCDYQEFERAGSIYPFQQVGGDASAREGWRIAASMLDSLYGEKGPEFCEALKICSKEQAALIGRMADRGLNTVSSTSAGRLFDAVSALLGIRSASTFEGEASTTLQFRAEEYLHRKTAEIRNRNGIAEIHEAEELCRKEAEEEIRLLSQQYPLLWEQHRLDGRRVLATQELFRLLTEWRKAFLSEQPRHWEQQESNEQEEICHLAYLFHALFARQLAELAKALCLEKHIDTIVLTGGVFQNTLLLELTQKSLREPPSFQSYWKDPCQSQIPLQILRHHQIPPNDGGLALGQAIYGMYYLKEHQGSK